MKKTKILYPRPFGLSHNPGIALTGTWCAPGIREGGGAGPVAWRKRGWKFSSEARARFAAPPHRQRPPRGPRRSGKTTGGALGRRHTFTLRGADPAPRFPTAPDKESSLTIARPETGRGDEEAYLPRIEGSEAEEPSWNQTIPQQGKRVNRARWLGLISYYLLNSYYTIILWADRHERRDASRCLAAWRRHGADPSGCRPLEFAH